MKIKLTPALLRKHAAAKDTVAWKGTAKMLLRWAADTLEAAERVIAERRNTRDER